MSESQSRITDPVVQSAARWFWWIAGLSVVNTALSHSGSDTNFVVGLGITAIADAVFAHARPIAFAIDAVAIGFFFLMGLHGARGKAWAFYVGLAVYVLDAFIYAKFGDWMPVAFHGLAIWFIAKGVLRLREPAPAVG